LSAAAPAIVNAKPASHPKRLIQDLELTKAEVSVLTNQAKAGVNQAAVKLAHYYDFYVHSYDAAKFWIENAAKNGDVQSQYNMGVRLMTQRKDSERCKEAEF
jgi:TPR repeat protein